MGKEAVLLARDRARAKEEAGWPERIRVDAVGLVQFMQQAAAVHPDRDALTIICIGTDCSTGDSLGPWVGTMLRQRGWKHVIGTLAEPCDANRYPASIASIAPDTTVIAIDACLGKPESVGEFLVANGPLFPARATGNRLPSIGAISIAGVVGPLSAKPYWSLQRASLLSVITMARVVADAFESAWIPEQSVLNLQPSVTWPII